ncbi:MAG: hypothetical protein LBD91_06010 [Prevotellaceae bacterium]|nr:hypothetical protein [Prevotellaceae bacterium]
MARNSSIPTKDVDFNVRQNVIATTASTNRTAWNLDDAHPRACGDRSARLRH